MFFVDEKPFSDNVQCEQLRGGRQFRAKNQWHSCLRYTADSHFEGRPPELRETFDFLIAKLRRFGQIRMDAVKLSIHIASRSIFAVVYVIKNSISLEFVLDRNLDDARIFRKQQVSKTQCSHFVKLARKEDVDAQVLGWLNEAYSLKKWYLFSVQLGPAPSASAKEPEKSIRLTLDKRRRVNYSG